MSLLIIARSIFCLLLFFVVFCFFPQQIFAATHVVINEFLANPDSLGSEWVEMYNPTETEVSLADWKLVDASNSVKSLTDLKVIPSGGFVVYEYPHDGWLNNSSAETIWLKDASSTVVDSYSYTVEQSENVTTGRSPDGSDNWVVLAQATKGSANSPAQPTATLTPTMAPTATSIPTPTKIPTPMPTSKPTSTPKPVATATSTSTSVPTTTKVSPSESVSPSQAEDLATDADSAPTAILGDMVTASPSAIPSGVVEEVASPFFSFSTLAIGIGFVFLVGSGILAFRSWKARNTYEE